MDRPARRRFTLISVQGAAVLAMVGSALLMAACGIWLGELLRAIVR